MTVTRESLVEEKGTAVQSRTAVVLVTRSAMTAAPVQELEQLAGWLSTHPRGAHVTFAFTEQGEPSLRTVVHRLRDERCREVVLVPMLVPMEPSYLAFITRTLHRWQAESPGTWPTFRIGQQSPAEMPSMLSMLGELVDHACSSTALESPSAMSNEGALVPTQKHRVLVCMAGPCLAVGASVVWGHLRHEQKRLNLRTTGDGMVSAKTSCLGPCNLAPVVQVFPEGVYYGGVNEEAIDRIISEHLRQGRPVDDLAYAPSATRQQLRSKA